MPKVLYLQFNVRPQCSGGEPIVKIREISSNNNSISYGVRVSQYRNEIKLQNGEIVIESKIPAPAGAYYAIKFDSMVTRFSPINQLARSNTTFAKLEFDAEPTTITIAETSGASTSKAFDVEIEEASGPTRAEARGASTSKTINAETKTFAIELDHVLINSKSRISLALLDQDSKEPEAILPSRSPRSTPPEEY